ncbi:MAG: hypothetical protein M3276_08870, partial [Actinomycetota bacterium]|nr:hypothetical protein [Actinomycetota bacterium]
MIDVDGTGQRQLTDFPHGMVQEPVWSPEGSSIGFARIVGAQFTSLYVIGADGTGLRQLTRPEAAGDSQPQWSPDGSRLVFIRFRFSPVDEDGYRDVVVVNVDGSGEQQLTDQAFASRAEWAPDGATIAFGIDSGAQFVITVARADGSAAGILPGNGVEPTWSPDGGQVAYLGFDDQPGRPLYASGPDGSGFRQVARAAGLGGRKAQNHLDWSADAAHLLYHDGQNLFVVDADGGQPQHIATAGANVSDAFFSPGVVLRLSGPS